MSSKSRSKTQASREQDAPQQEEELLKHPVMMYPPITPVMVMAQQVPFYAQPDETSQVVGGARMKEVVPVLQSQGPWLMTVANFEEAWFQADWVAQVEQDSPDQYFKDQQVITDAFEERQDQTEDGEPVKTETRPYMEMADGYGMAVMPETTEELFVQAYAELIYAFEPNAELMGTYRHLMQVFSPDSLVELEDYITLPAEVQAGEKTGEGPMLPEERERAERSAETDTTAAQRSEQANAPGAAGRGEEQGARSVGILAAVSPAVLMLVARSWGVDLSDVELVEDPALVAQGRKGAVRDGKTVRLAPGATNDVEVLLEELCHIVQHRNAARGGADERAPRDEGALEAEAEQAVQAARQGERFEVVGVASRELHDDGDPVLEPGSTDAESEAAAPPRPGWIADEQTWRAILDAVESDPDLAVDRIIAAVPMLRSIDDERISLRVVEGRSDAQTVAADETVQWLQQSYQQFREETSNEVQDLDETRLARRFIEKIRAQGIPTEFHRVTILIPIQSLSQNSLDSLVATLRHEFNHGHQYLNDYLRIFPFAVTPDNDWLPGVELNEVMSDELTDLGAEKGALEVASYYESVVIASLLDLKLEESRSFGAALQRALMIANNWEQASASAAVRQSFADGDEWQSKFGTALLYFLSDALRLLESEVAQLRTTVYGEVDRVPALDSLLEASNTATPATGEQNTNGDHDAGSSRTTPDDAATAKPPQIPPGRLHDALLAYAEDIDKSHLLSEMYGRQRVGGSLSSLPDTVEGMLAAAEERFHLAWTVDDLARMHEHLTYLKTDGLGWSEYSSRAAALANQQATDPDPFEMVERRFPEAGQTDLQAADRNWLRDVYVPNARSVREQISHIVVTGYSDDLGSADEREAVALERATSTANVLREALPGIEVEVVSGGYMRPERLGPHYDLERQRLRLEGAHDDQDRRRIEARISDIRERYRRVEIRSVRK